MKKLAIAAVLAAVSLAGAATAADAQVRHRHHGGGGSIIQTSPGIDINTLLLLGTLGAGGAGANAVLPLALLGATLAQPSETVVTRRGRRR